MGNLEERLRRLEEQLIRVPSVDEYLDASNRERLRSLHALAVRLAPHGYEGGHLFTEENRRMLAEDTPERRERDRDIIERWREAEGVDRAAELEGAKEKLLARLEVRSK
jgi:hypothetical protein